MSLAVANPDHLEPVTNAENHARARKVIPLGATHCIRGHDLSRDLAHNIRGHVVCRGCARESQAALRRKAG